ncbi:DEAD/DEAH box helicase [Clavibacter zhangzhiyongii]|uniref:DEAD/DEAH box helicase n=1 Tax=Clavibacter zhangzhiyongii TaxID=2768071 RepID=UPI0039DF7646
MKFNLLDFQRTATDALLAEIYKAQARYDNDPEVLGAVVLEAATGAGKTVIATAAVEQLIFGSDSAEPVYGTTILWVTNDPSLNAQTARKMQEASDKIADIRLIGQGASFDEPEFEPGVIYFLNTQSASAAGRITRRSDTQAWTIWDTIGNTVKKLGSKFVVIVDEAHYGVTEKPGGSPTIINKIANGKWPIPVFVGISATAHRLNKALDAQGRLKKNVIVPIDMVRESGLVKDRIVLAPAAEQGDVIADTTFVRLGVQKVLEYEARWAEYTSTQNEVPVRPALVIQLPDQKADDSDFVSLVRTVYDATTQEWPGLLGAQVVHTFAEHVPMDLGGGKVVRYMPPQDIQDATEVRVVLAKNAITTGWDCPRAEVLVSLRASVEFTPVAQLIGRIVRQPLARRVVSDESLNRVHAYLPRFDRNTVMKVVSAFAGTGGGESAEVVRVTLNYEAPESMRAALDTLSGLPAYHIPSRATSPETRRLHALATLLENDGLRGNAVAQANAYLNSQLDHEATKLEASGELEEKRRAVASASVYELLTSIDGSVIDGERVAFGTRLDAKNIDDVFRRASRTLKDGTAEAYWSYLVDKDFEDDPVEAKITVAALALSEHVVTNVQEAAASLTSDWLNKAAKQIAFLEEGPRTRYARLQAEATEPKPLAGIVVGGTIEDAVSIAASSELTDAQLQKQIVDDHENRWSKHLYQDATDGRYWKKPTSTDGLERRVLESELKSGTLVGWYRNPAGGERALCIPYVDSGTGRWSGLYPDFVFFHLVGDKVRASIVDPHGIQLEDWGDKLRGYLDYAEAHAAVFRGIAPVTQIDGKMLFLAIHDQAVRSKVRGALEDGTSVEAIFREHGIGY